jgi:hypothetical protein
LIFRSCEKNAVYYNLRASSFPNVKNIILFYSHPCEYHLPWWFPKARWICTRGYDRYFEGIENYQVLTAGEVEEFDKAFKMCDYYVAKTGGKYSEQLKIHAGSA